ncbi:MAG: acyl-CoA/acyl-ACP dehydrogenase [Planctomycetales bacterium]|nr:acyl-CoA/acyl-ACP dehydrogenase [Planctomycetales bacterium]
MSDVVDQLEDLVAFLREHAEETDRRSVWPREQLRRCAEAGIVRWYVPPELGGVAKPQADMLAVLSRLASGCLTSAFCLTQPTGVAARVAAGDNDELKRRVLPELLDGRAYGAVGIAQLTTSRRHVQPVMRARETAEGYVLDGTIPWVTGGAHAKWIVTGATLDDGRQLLGVLPTDRPGITVEPAAEMVGLTATSTGPVRCENVLLEREWLLAPVVPDVLKHGKGAGTGGLQTSALALGVTAATVEYLQAEATRRDDLKPIAAELETQRAALASDLAALAEISDVRVAGAGAAGEAPVISTSKTGAPLRYAPATQGCPLPTPDDVRHRANGLALRSAQAALAAAKGSGYVVGHPAGRWCREALFFLVWSCPQPVVTATLCEMAKL